MFQPQQVNVHLLVPLLASLSEISITSSVTQKSTQFFYAKIKGQLNKVEVLNLGRSNQKKKWAKNKMMTKGWLYGREDMYFINTFLCFGYFVRHVLGLTSSGNRRTVF